MKIESRKTTKVGVITSQNDKPSHRSAPRKLTHLFLTNHPPPFEPDSLSFHRPWRVRSHPAFALAAHQTCAVLKG